MTKKDTGPLTWNVPIVNRAGLPSSEFQRRWETLRTNDNLLQTVEVGKGVPKTTPADGEAYVDMSVSPAVLYVGDNGKWRITGTLPSVGTIVGPPGQDGEEGPMGPPGPQGLAGATGATGATGPAGPSPSLARSVVQQQCSSYNAGQTTAGFTTCILPTAPTQGNLLVAIMQWNNVNGTPAAGTGWTLAAYDHTTTNPFGVMSALFWKYAGAGESTSQTPGNAGLTYGSTNIWEISGVSGTWATDFVAFSFNDAPAGQPVLAFTDDGYTTANANSLVLAFIGGNNSIGYATPAAMTQIGAGTLVPDTHIGATGGPSGVSAVAGHYTSVTTAGTVLKGHSSSSNSSSWFSAYVELTSGNASAGPQGPQGVQGVQGQKGIDGTDGEDGQWGPPGPMGAIGPTGATGATGPVGMMGMDGNDGEDGLTVPGPVGPTGAAGAIGPAGPAGSAGMMGLDGIDGEDGMVIPGPAGDAGAAGQGFNFRGAWVSGTVYAPYDVVTDAGSTYNCIVGLTSTTAPGSDATHFTLMAQSGAAGASGLLAYAGTQTGRTQINSSATPTSANVTLASQTLSGSGPITVWRIRAFGSFTAVSSATTRTGVITPFWGTSALTAISATVLASTAQGTAWEFEYIIRATSASGAWVTGYFRNQLNSTTIQTQTLLSPTTNLTGLPTGAQTVDLRFSVSSVVNGEAWFVDFVTIERLS